MITIKRVLLLQRETKKGSGSAAAHQLAVVVSNVSIKLSAVSRVTIVNFAVNVFICISSI
jgi:hypothetical protein